MAETVAKTWTYDRLIAEGIDPEGFEVAHGELVPVKEIDMRGAWIFSLLCTKLTTHVLGTGAGKILTTGRFLLSEDPRIERRPDLAFVSNARIPSPEPPMFPGAPDVAIEVVSPSDPSGAVADKAEEYVTHGARECWIVEPALRTVVVFRPGRDPKAYSSGDTRESPELPGLRIALSELFTPPTAASS